MERIGNLCEIHRKFEWKIKDFLLLQDKLGEGYKSPQYSFSGVSWEIWIYPYGRKKDESLGWISVFLVPTSLHKCVTIDLSLSFKTVKGRSDLERTLSHLFNVGDSGRGFQFILRSDFIKRKSELLSSDALTVICTLKDSEPNVVSENIFLDAISQTEEGASIWKLQQHLREISLNGDISDVILKVKDREFKSHRCILAARSPVFAAMMKSEMKENVTGIVDIDDIDPEIFSNFLNYLYTGSEEDIQSGNVIKLYTAADKYQVKVLKEICLDYMLANVCIENFCDIFIISVQYNEEKLKETCIQYFVKHSLDIIKSCKWQSFLCENPIMCNELHIKYLELNKDISHIA